MAGPSDIIDSAPLAGHISRLFGPNSTTASFNVESIPLPQDGLTVVLTVVVGLAVILGLASKDRWLRHWRLRQFPHVGADPGFWGLNINAAKADFHKNGFAITKKGYAEYPDSPFIIQTNDQPRVIVPLSVFDKEIKHLAFSHVSVKQALIERFMDNYTGMGSVADNENHRQIVRVNLTQHLDVLLPVMKERADAYLESQLKLDAEGKATINVFHTVLNAISRITARVMCDDLADDAGWQETVINYTEDTAKLAAKLQWWPTWSRWAVINLYPVEKAKSQKHIDRARYELGPIMRERRAKGVKKVDVLQWLSDGEPKARPEKLAVKILFIVIAAVHTSTMALTHALYDLAANPELADELRAEIEEHLGGQKWTLAKVRKMRLMDSFLKESHRINQPGVLSLNRSVRRDVVLKSGKIIPKGSMISIAAGARARDETVWAEPEKFDPLRFYEPDSHGDGRNQYTSTNGGESFFGFGPQSCPGRWYAETQIKLCLSFLLQNYDFEFPNGRKTRPANVTYDERMAPDTTQELVFKLRT